MTEPGAGDRSWSAGIWSVVVDVAGQRGQQRVRAGWVGTPALPGQIRRQLHQARTLTRAAVPAPRQGRDQLRWMGTATRHGHLPAPANLLRPVCAPTDTHVTMR